MHEFFDIVDETLRETNRLISLQNLPYVQLFVGVRFIIDNALFFCGPRNLSLGTFFALFDSFIRLLAQEFGFFVIYWRERLLGVDFEPELLVDESLSLVSSFHVLIDIADWNNKIGVKRVNNVNQHAQKHS